MITQEEVGLQEYRLPILQCNSVWYLQQLREAEIQEQMREQVLDALKNLGVSLLMVPYLQNW